MRTLSFLILFTLIGCIEKKEEKISKKAQSSQGQDSGGFENSSSKFVYPTSEYISIPQNIEGCNSIASNKTVGVYVDSNGLIYAGAFGGLSKTNPY